MKVAAQAHRAGLVSVVLMVGRERAHELRRGGGQHDSREAAVLVERVQRQRGDAGQRRAVLQAVWVDVGGSRRALGCRYCCRVVPRVRTRPVRLQLRVMHQLRGDVRLTGVSQGVLHGPLQLHPPVLEPVSDLRRRNKKSDEEKFCPTSTFKTASVTDCLTDRLSMTDRGSVPVCRTGWASCTARPCLVFPGTRSSWTPAPCCWSAPPWRPCEASSLTEATPARRWRCSRWRGSDLLHSRSRRSPPRCRCWTRPRTLQEEKPEL